MDFRILLKHLYSETHQELSLSDYTKLRTLIDKDEQPLLFRLNEFYGKTFKYNSLEVPRLFEELHALANKTTNTDLLNLISGLEKVAKEAMHEKKSLEILTD